jgi:hypothetical protein
MYFKEDLQLLGSELKKITKNLKYNHLKVIKEYCMRSSSTSRLINIIPSPSNLDINNNNSPSPMDRSPSSFFSTTPLQLDLNDEDINEYNNAFPMESSPRGFISITPSQFNLGINEDTDEENSASPMNSRPSSFIGTAQLPCRFRSIAQPPLTDHTSTPPSIKRPKFHRIPLKIDLTSAAPFTLFLNAIHDKCIATAKANNESKPDMRLK